MNMNTITVPVTLIRRPLWKRILRFPFVAHRHYAVMRLESHGRIVSVYAAWLLAGVTVKVGNAK